MNSRVGFGLLVCALAAMALPSPGNEVTVKNDSYVDGGSVYVVGDFIAGEQAGARLTSPCNGYIVAVQVAWMSATGGADATIERYIHIYDGSTFPTPGTELASLEAPYMTPGAFNEFRYLDDQNSIPIHVPVTTGQQFYVTFEFDNATNVAGGSASVCRDANGCQTGKNHLFAIPGGWYNSCLLGINGDWLIRAVIDCNVAGACCLLDGSCQSLSQSQCSTAGGVYKGDGTTCTSSTCTGACCITSTHGCLNLTKANCTTASGTWAGPSTTCATYVCFPIGACCLPDGTCQDNKSPEECAALNGTFKGNATTCGGVTCPPATGACCFPGGGCIELSQSDCGVAAGSWKGPGTNCDDNNSNGTADACETQTPKGDMNCDGVVNNQDIDGFVLALFNATGYAQQYPNCNILNGDFTNDSQVNNQDIDGFVSALFQ